MAEHRTESLQIFGVMPEVEPLFNDRARMTVRCELPGNNQAWYYDNRHNLFSDYGSLHSAGFGDAPINDTPDGSDWPDMRLVSHGLEYVPQKDIPVLRLNYETLTGTWTKEREDVIGSTENGLRTLTRSEVAKIDTAAPYDEDDVGVVTIENGGKTLYLAGFEDQTKADDQVQIGRVVSRWAEFGIASQTTDHVGSQRAIVIEAFGETPATPSGYSLARTDVSNVEGIETNRYTFLKPSILSRSEDKVGSQLAIVVEAFDETPDTPSGYSLARTDVSNVEGIETNRYTFLKNGAVLSRSISERSGGTGTTGKLRLEVVEVFNGEPTSEISGVQIGDVESNVDGIPTRRYTFAKGDGQIRTSTQPGPTAIPGTTYVTVESLGTPVVPDGELVSSADIEQDGYVRYVRTALQGTIEGTKQTYKDVVEVQTPGTVECTTQAVSNSGSGGGTGNSTVSGTIAVVNVTPIRTKQVAANVTVEIASTPPDTISLAYDLGDISCSVTTVQESFSRQAGPTVTVSDGNTTLSQTGFRQNFSGSVNIQTYPGHYLTAASSNGAVTYTSANVPRENGNTIVFDAASSSVETTCTGTGSTDDTGYTTTGVVRRRSRPILTTIAGTTYYEVITWSV